MKKSILLILLSTVLIVSLTVSIVLSDEPGPAPNSGDGIPEGSGFNRNNWPNDDSPGKGPAPNSGDCVPDGSGF